MKKQFYRPLLIGSLGLLAPMPAMANPAPQVTIEQGRLAGAQDGDVVAYKGIPFAAPPVDALRWRAPQAPQGWTGLRDATRFGHDCLQNYTGFQPDGSQPAEDCLYLNVWRPRHAAKKLPVLVWIYGGGFVNGSSSRPIYDGARLARKGIVVVSLNYRLGRFGTFAHPALTKANEDQGQFANYGFMDQVAALKWVQRNIGAFGGDRAQVTIFGESAGGMSVHNLLTSPMGVGLFRRAAIASGGNGTALKERTLAQAEAIGADFGASQQIAAEDPAALSALRALPASAVLGDIKLGSVLAEGKRTFSSPFPDGKVALDQLAAYQAGRFRHVPVMIGATSGDMGGPTGMMIKGARDLAGLLAKAGVPVYYYRFSYVAQGAPTGKQAGAIHADDLPYYFNNADVKYEAQTQPTDMAMGRAISNYLVDFVKAGNPNGAGRPLWPAYRAGGVMMDFNTAGRAQPRRETSQEISPDTPVKGSGAISPSAG